MLTRTKLAAKIMSITFLIAFTNIIAGCMPEMKMWGGRKPDLSMLERHLQVGRSSPDDVLAALGPPLGTGRAMLPVNPKPLTLWSYNYTEAEIRKEKDVIGILYLFVFFDQDRYAGYLWFSSVPE